MRNVSDITHVCICGSAYALLQYLLLEEEDVIRNHTYYIVGSGIKSEIASRLPEYTQFETTPCQTLWHKIKRVFVKLNLRYVRNKRFPFMQTAKIYAQDYLYPIIAIGQRPYNMLQESPLHMTVNYGKNSQDLKRVQTHLQSLSGRLEQRLYGKVLLSLPASTVQCQKIYLTEPNDSPLLAGKECEILSLASLWEHSSETKKDFVRGIFHVSREEVQVPQGSVFLTQPLVDDGILTASEYKALLDKLFSHYQSTELCIKVHPRDTYDYSTNFPNFRLMNKPINLELLFLIGWKCDCVISICSTAVNAVPEGIEVEWYGAEVHPKLSAYFGDTMLPCRKYRKMEL